MKPRGLKINGKKKKKEWEKKLQNFEFSVKRSNKILKDMKSKEQLQQIPSIHNKLLKIFPSGTILKDINLIEKFLQISNSIRENYFDIEFWRPLERLFQNFFEHYLNKNSIEIIALS